MGTVIQHNLSMMNTQNKYKVNIGNQAKATEKLSSGFRINKAADDAAGLSISEKMRWQIRGLNRGSLNAQEGISWIQVGDGALNEVHAMIHRMKELTVQSLNDTNTDSDRAALQAEFDALQTEIDRVSDTTQFNTKNIFSDHKPTYYELDGNREWAQSQKHMITADKSDLNIAYVDSEGQNKNISISVKEGLYTTQELADEIDTALNKAGVTDVFMEYADDGTFNLNVEGGDNIESATGGLTYLLNDVFEGGSVGSLVGTTIFVDEYSPLTISSQNNNMSFSIEDFNGNKTIKNVTLPTGSYTKQQIIDMLNDELKDTTVKATEFGTGIKLASNDSIITGFKGNMFKIDEGNNVYTSVFYDNVKYGNISMTAASLVGNAVIPTDSRDVEHQKFIINSTGSNPNNTLVFKANGSTTETTIIIPDGEYTVEQMVTKLDELFVAEGLELDAVINSSSDGKYKGITINSTVKGATSVIGLDSTSNAYDTLFVDRVYNNYISGPAYYRDTKDDETATFTGSKAFTGSNIPFVITAGVNDKFYLNIDNDSPYEITLKDGVYVDALAVQTQINEQLNGANASGGYKDKVVVSLDSGKIKLTGADGSGIINLSTSAVSNNSGYSDIFVGVNVTYKTTTVSNTGTSTTPPSVTLNNPISDPATITSGNNTITIKVDGVDRTVTLPTGSNVTHDDITDAIEDQIAQNTSYTPNTFTNINAVGTTTSNHFSDSGTGSTTKSTKNYSAVGDSRTNQGSTSSYVYNEGAKVVMSVALGSTTIIDDDCNYFQISINGKEQGITLENGIYSQTALVDRLQKKIDEKFGVYNGGAIVDIESGKLTFTARLNTPGTSQIPGASTNISFSTSTSSFIQELHTQRKAANIETKALNSSIVIADGANTFNFKYTENGVQRDVSLTLDNGTYTHSMLEDEINAKLSAQNINVVATVKNGKLYMETVGVGTGNGISFSTTTGGTAVEAMFGEMTTKKAAEGTAKCDTLDSITIGTSIDDFSVTVNGTPYNIKLQQGTFTRVEFINMLNSKLSDAGTGLIAEPDGKRIKYRTEKTGADASFSLSYGTGGSSMIAIYGESSKTTAGIDAEFTADNKLKLTGTINGGSLSVTSSSGGIAQTQERIETPIAVDKNSGYVSNKKAYLDGYNITEPLTIDKWNDELTFVYYNNGTEKNVSVTLGHKDYIFAELQSELQTAIDTQVGAGEINVTVNASGVRFEATKPGSKYYMKDFDGDFYDKVLYRTEERTTSANPKISNGSKPSDSAYTVGRKDVKNKSVEIKTGVTDTLSLDFTYGGSTKTITMVLDSGTYKGDSLKNMIQEKLNEQLVLLGLAENTIKVGIGGINTGVQGANDANALNFELSKEVRLPAEGQYIIDGVSGNAAFNVFYQTDGELKEAYIKGSKDISEGVVIEDGANDLTFDVDGTTYTVNIASGEYTADEIVTEINDQLAIAGAPVGAEIEDGVLKLMYNKLGSHRIDNVTGGAKGALFFKEEGAVDQPDAIMIQVGSRSYDGLEIGIPCMNTKFLGINSVAITRPKYANKALVRLEEALDKVSDIRSTFGALQNRLEHSVNNNDNTSENTQSAESRLRDTDMAQMMVEYSKNNILQQAAQAMMTQINASSSDVLKLLQS